MLNPRRVNGEGSDQLGSDLRSLTTLRHFYQRTPKPVLMRIRCGAGHRVVEVLVQWRRPRLRGRFPQQARHRAPPRVTGTLRLRLDPAEVRS
jgi:hypothetical protein